MGCGVFWHQVGELDRALGALRIGGISELSAPYRQLSSLRGKLMKQVGFKFPREVQLVMRLVGLSPGTIKLWHDVESGWMAEARTGPGAPPVYRSVTDAVAITILKGELTHELEAELMTPDPYIGE